MMFSGKFFAISALMILALSVMSMGLTAAQPVALSQEDNAVELVKLYSAKGKGIAVQDQDPYRSRIWAVAYIEVEPTETSDRLIEFGIRKGTIIVDEHLYDAVTVEDAVCEAFKMVPDTWEGVICPDGKNLEAKGIVVDRDGNEYVVKLEGIAATKTSEGLLLFVKGTMFDDLGVVYDLYYKIYVHEIMPTPAEAEPLRLRALQPEMQLNE